MDLKSVGRLIAQTRREKGLTLRELAGSSGVGRSTLAGLEAGTLRELGYEKVARICVELGMTLEPRALALDTPLMDHRHLTDRAARDLTKAAIEDIVVRGDISAWRGLSRAIREDGTGRIAARARQVLARADQSDPKVRAYSALLSDLSEKKV